VAVHAGRKRQGSWREAKFREVKAEQARQGDDIKARSSWSPIS
jgi:hypothetical protein